MKLGGARGMGGVGVGKGSSQKIGRDFDGDVRNGASAF
jgi:hypothetical protein